MKRLIMLIFFLYLSTGLLTSPLVEDKEDSIEEWMSEKFEDWDKWDQREQQVIINLFMKSGDKHAWFPDKYIEPPVMSFTIYPEGWMKRKIERILNE